MWLVGTCVAGRLFVVGGPQYGVSGYLFIEGFVEGREGYDEVYAV